MENSYICIECLQVLLKTNRNKKYTTLYRKDNSSVKRHKDFINLLYNSVS